MLMNDKLNNLCIFHSTSLLLSSLITESQPFEQLGDAFQDFLKSLLLLKIKTISH